MNWDLKSADVESPGFRGYMACGNDGDEGESGQTWDPLLIVPAKEGFESGSVDPDTIDEKEIEDFTFNFRLDAKYPVGPYCEVTIKINTGNFLVDTLYLNGKKCTMSGSTGTCKPGQYISAGSDLVFKFANVYVDADVNSDATVTSEYFNFVTDVYVNGDWRVHGLTKTDTWNGYVYYCTDLDSSGEDCDSVTNENVRVKVNKDTNSHKINKVFVSPNNLRNDLNKWWSDLFIEFDIAADMPYVNNYAKIYLDIPSVYDINTGITNNDWIFYCFPNFKATCSLSSNKRVTLIPKTDVSGVKSVWILQTLKNPIANITSATKDTYFFSGFSEWRDKEMTSSVAASADLRNGMYVAHTSSA